MYLTKSHPCYVSYDKPFASKMVNKGLLTIILNKSDCYLNGSLGKSIEQSFVNKEQSLRRLWAAGELAMKII